MEFRLVFRLPRRSDVVERDQAVGRDPDVGELRAPEMNVLPRSMSWNTTTCSLGSPKTQAAIAGKLMPSMFFFPTERRSSVRYDTIFNPARSATG